MNVFVSTSQGDATMRNSIISALKARYKSDLSQLGNHVMFCYPPGTMSDVAYAYINWHLSVYLDDWCTYVSAQVHKIGHNLNLAHSTNKNGEYEDQSCMVRVLITKLKQ